MDKHNNVSVINVTRLLRHAGETFSAIEDGKTIVIMRNGLPCAVLSPFGQVSNNFMSAIAQTPTLIPDKDVPDKDVKSEPEKQVSHAQTKPVEQDTKFLPEPEAEEKAEEVETETESVGEVTAQYQSSPDNNEEDAPLTAEQYDQMMANLMSQM